MRRHARQGRLALAPGIALLVTMGLVPSATAAPQGNPQPLNVLNTSPATPLAGTNGVGRIMVPGRTCSEGGSGNYRHYSFDGPIPAGVLSQLTGTLRGSVDVHHDGVEPPVGPVSGGAFLLGDQNHVTLTNYRGAVQLILHGGQCTSATSPLTFSADGHQIAAGPFNGKWDITSDIGSTNGAYRSASGSGSYTLTAGVAPGADNPWSLQLSGNISILEPKLTATVVKTFWGNLGLDYATRIVSVTYQITNTGTTTSKGDAFNTAVSNWSSPTNDVHPLGPSTQALGDQLHPQPPSPQPLGDLLSGQSTQVTLRYQLGLLSPCLLVILNCNFTSVVTMSGPDALDVPGTFSSTLPVTAPNLPPPLS
jgi:hypothetical protein